MVVIFITDFHRRKSLQIGFKSGGNAGVFITQPYIYDAAFCENSQWLWKTLCWSLFINKVASSA